jgi:hypothetical protein
MLQGIEWCQLESSPAVALLTRLTLLRLRECCLTDLADALPAQAVWNLKVLDISGNHFGEKSNGMAPWTAENVAAFSSGIGANLQVLGIRPSCRYIEDKRHSLEATADALGAVLQQQAAAAQLPRPAPIVVFSEVHAELLLPAENLAVLT